MKRVIEPRLRLIGKQLPNSTDLPICHASVSHSIHKPRNCLWHRGGKNAYFSTGTHFSGYVAGYA